MSQINKKLQPFVISDADSFTVKSLKEKYEEMEKVCEDLEPSEYSTLPPGYTYTAKPYMFPILKEHTVPFKRGKDDTPSLAKCFLKSGKLLEELYNAIVVAGEIYHKNHPDVVKTKDTERYILKERAYSILTGGYAEKKGNLIFLPHRDGYASKKDVVETADTGNLELKQDCYKYRDGNTTQYYRYRDLAPDAPERVVHFSEAIFPKPEELSETRIGVEFEFSSAIRASKSALLNSAFRQKWNSVHDGTLPERGTEFVSVPLQYSELPDVSRFLQFCLDNGAKVNKSCGYHVHIGSPKMDFMGLTSIVLLCQNIERDLFKLVPDHRQDNRYCKRLDESFEGFTRVTSNDDEEAVANLFYEGSGATLESRHKESKWAVGSKRHYWMSIDRFFRFKKEPEKRTVEFRMHHATEEPEEFMQFILLCYYIVEYALSVNKKTARNSNLHDILDYIRNREDRNRIEQLLVSKKAIRI